MANYVEAIIERNPLEDCSSAIRKVLRYSNKKKRNTRRERPRSPNVLLKTVDDLCKYIRESTSDSERKSENEATPYTRSARDPSIWLVMEKVGVSDEAQRLLKTMRRMESSGNSNDCLIHTLLTAVCPVFRTLEKPEKNRIAREVRRKIIPRLMAEEGEERDATLLSNDFLEDTHVGLLSRLFKINILMLESEKSEKIGKETYKQPPMATFHEGGEGSGGTPVYIFFNDDNVHFESVRAGEAYTISYSDAKKIEREYAFGVGGGRRGRLRRTRRLWRGSRRPDVF